MNDGAEALQSFDTASITELRKDFNSVLSRAQNTQNGVVILNHSKKACHVLTPEQYEELIKRRDT